MKTECTQKELASAIKRSTRQVHNLTEKGVFTRVPSTERPGTLVYPWPDSVHAFIAYTVRMQVFDRQAANTEEADRRKAIADAELKEMKVAQMRAELLARVEYRKELTRVLRRVREALDTMPAKHAPKLPGEATMGEKVGALRKVALELFEELRRAGYPDDDDEDTGAAA